MQAGRKPPYRKEGTSMKVKDLVHNMNDHGTKPRVRVIAHRADYPVLLYEGSIENFDLRFADLKVNSFTALGKGFIEIHTS